ncbi:uncharacterized protein I303_104487 [Kwoniella dejecticola CBS 10117]|uniref:Short-chain dehydrogenase n=1 Tax=Kwoniella dejecticola CBS 10117 TaxID=1296121 RepID=A0A1A6A584_9TREE|nr:uncharacterized protein I303_04535 [Kwoniella dejecticola CBS 10117]OBR85203.1 hypothetical protein I303_04535 [Kwoniella dejecticola CBS 10117]
MANPVVVLITGANSGVGYQTALALFRSAKETYQIYVGARSQDKATEAIKQLQTENAVGGTQSDLISLVLDVADDHSISQAFDYVKESSGRLDVLINNAGILIDHQGQSEGLTTRQIFSKSFDVNVTGAHIVTDTFAPLLVQSRDPKLLFLGTSMASLVISQNPSLYFNQSPPSGWPKQSYKQDFWAYKSTKLALMMIMRDWPKTLKNDGVKTWAINPGLVQTNLGNNPELLKSINAGDPHVPALLIRDVIEGKSDEDVGKMIAPDGDYFGSLVPW